MALLILSFVAGVLTVAAPCILPLLPVIVGGTILQVGDKHQPKRDWLRPFVVALSLSLSVVLFTLLLKATTTLLGVPQFFWQVVSGGIVLLFGLNLLFPQVWDKIIIASGFELKTNRLLGASNQKKGIWRDILIGAALGPVFASCSPTYALIVATILPQSFAVGVTYLLAYAAGLSSILILVGISGQALVRKLGWLSNPNGWFKKSLGIIFVIVGLAVLFGLDKQFQAWVLQSGLYAPIEHLENSLR